MPQDLTKIGNHLPTIKSSSQISTSTPSLSNSKNTTSTLQPKKPTKSTGNSHGKSGFLTPTNGQKKNWLTKQQPNNMVTTNDRLSISRLTQYQTIKSLEPLSTADCYHMIGKVNDLVHQLSTMEGATKQEIAKLMHNLALVIRSTLPGADEPDEQDRQTILTHYATELSSVPYPLLQKAFQHLRKHWKYKTFPKIAEILEPIKEEMGEIETMYKGLIHLNKLLSHRIERDTGESP